MILGSALIFAFVAFLDLPVALTLFIAALTALAAPSLWHRFDSRKSLERQDSYALFASEFLDAVQGLATLKAFGQSRPRAELLAEKARDLFRTTMWVLATNSLSRGITDTSRLRSDTPWLYHSSSRDESTQSSAASSSPPLVCSRLGFSCSVI